MLWWIVALDTDGAMTGIGYRTNNALIAYEENIVKPEDASDEFQGEGELVAVIAKMAKHQRKEDTLSCVLGWTIGGEVSVVIPLVGTAPLFVLLMTFLWRGREKPSWRVIVGAVLIVLGVFLLKADGTPPPPSVDEQPAPLSS